MNKQEGPRKRTGRDALLERPQVFGKLVLGQCAE